MKSKLSIDSLGTKSWRLNGMLHREDGPAIIYSDGTEKYYLFGTEYSKKEYVRITRKSKLDQLSKQHILS